MQYFCNFKTAFKLLEFCDVILSIKNLRNGYRTLSDTYDGIFFSKIVDAF